MPRVLRFPVGRRPRTLSPALRRIVSLIVAIEQSSPDAIPVIERLLRILLPKASRRRRRRK